VSNTHHNYRHHDAPLDPLAHLGADLRARYDARYGVPLGQIKLLGEQISALQSQLNGASLLPPQHLGRNSIPGIESQIAALTAQRDALQATLESDLATAAAPFIAVQAERAALQAEIAGLTKSLAGIPPIASHPSQALIPQLEADLAAAIAELEALG
jgi:hypothetical protein